jgi:hypothetical protein
LYHLCTSAPDFIGVKKNVHQVTDSGWTHGLKAAYCMLGCRLRWCRLVSAGAAI